MSRKSKWATKFQLSSNSKDQVLVAKKAIFLRRACSIPQDSNQQSNSNRGISDSENKGLSKKSEEEDRKLSDSMEHKTQESEDAKLMNNESVIEKKEDQPDNTSACQEKVNTRLESYNDPRPSTNQSTSLKSGIIFDRFGLFCFVRTYGHHHQK